MRLFLACLLLTVPFMTASGAQDGSTVPGPQVPGLPAGQAAPAPAAPLGTVPFESGARPAEPLLGNPVTIQPVIPGQSQVPPAGTPVVPGVRNPLAAPQPADQVFPGDIPAGQAPEDLSGTPVPAQVRQKEYPLQNRQIVPSPGQELIPMDRGKF